MDADRSRPAVANGCAGTLLSVREAAERLGISVNTLYGWLAQSDAGLFVIRGQPVTIEYFQGGANGRGRIQINAQEVQRLREHTRVHPRMMPLRRVPAPQRAFPGITVELGRPE